MNCLQEEILRSKMGFAKLRLRVKQAVISLYSIYWTEYALVFVLVMRFWLFEPVQQVNVPFVFVTVSSPLSEVNKDLIASSLFQILRNTQNSL